MVRAPAKVSCFDTGQVFETAPCTNLERTVKENGNTFRLNGTFHVTDDVMFYATCSEGFRPGGVNRRGTFPPYDADFLTNYEIGWKTSWADDRLRFNGAIYKGDWDDFQFSFLGENGLTNVTNAGAATLEGVEVDLQWAASDSFTLYGGLALQKAELAKTSASCWIPTASRSEAECLRRTIPRRSHLKARACPRPRSSKQT